MKKLIAAGALLLLLAGCAQVDSGVVRDKTAETGRTEYDCDGKGTKRKCGWETLPDKCMFYLDNGKDQGWLEVSCAVEYNSYNVGDPYPR